MIEGEVEEEVKKVKLCDHPKYSKYFNMLKKGVPLPGVRHAMMRDKMDASVLDRDPNEEVELEEGVKEEEEKSEVKKVKLCEHPKYSKYFNMLKKGVPLPGVRHAMMRDGVDASVLDKDPNEEVELEEEKSEVKKVKLCEHPKYSKYFNMLKKGLPETSVRHAMMRDGVDASILDKDPNEEVELEEEKSEEKKDEVKRVKLCEHPKYAKYFNMLKKGLPETSVRHAMMRDGVDASVLDKDPNEEVELEEEKSEVKKDEVKKVKLCEHPKYSKYFNMLKKGLPETAVRHAMMRDKVDSSVLDKDPNEEVELEEEKKEKSEVKRVKLCEHPKYSKYFNMLKKGLPETAVRHAMMRDKVDASVLDKDPNEEVELEEEKKSEVKKVKLCEHPKYSKYFNMLKKGLPDTAVRHAMMRDKVDSSVLDRDPNEEVELEEEKKEEVVKRVKLCEHPKYSKYFNMLKKGLPDTSVRHAMMRDKVDVSILDRDPNEEVELEEEKSEKKQTEEEDLSEFKPERIMRKVPLYQHPDYEQYFTLLDRHVPRVEVEYNMRKANKDVKVLDMDRNTLFEIEVSATWLSLCLGHFGSPLAASRLRQVLFHAEGRSAEEGCGEEDEGRWRESCCTCACCRLNGRSWATIGIVDGMWTRRVGLRRGREEQFGRSCTGTW